MIVHRRFQYPVSPKKAIEVQFNLEFDGNKVNVTTVQINGNYSTGLPTSPELKQHQNKWKFYEEFEVKEGDNFVRRFCYHDDEVSQGIIKRILEFVEEETPKFSN